MLTELIENLDFGANRRAYRAKATPHGAPGANRLSMCQQGKVPASVILAPSFAVDAFVLSSE